jgi:tripartite-type tricarboxylate transporter receptor subunit TctC
MRRSLLVGGIILAIGGFIIGLSPASAQTYPNRPVQYIIPGGLMLDLSGRIIAEELGKVLGTPMVVLNKPGASLTLGTDFVVRSKKDGYTLLYTATARWSFPGSSTPSRSPTTGKKIWSRWEGAPSFRSP